MHDDADRGADRPPAPTHRLSWRFGNAEVQTLGAMLGPLVFRLDQERELDVLHVAPWANATGCAGLPAMLQGMRGEWPCFPFGRSDRPRDLPRGWRTREADDDLAHGFGAHHVWTCIDATDTQVHLAIDYPPHHAIARIERIISADPSGPAVSIVLRITVRRPARVPAGLHPTFRIPDRVGRVNIELGKNTGLYSYPGSPAGAVSRLVPDARSDSLRNMRGVGCPVDLSHLPLSYPAEELVQARDIQGDGAAAPLVLRYLDYGASVGLWWDLTQFPDLLLWVSNRGRVDWPWMGRHIALGAEPVNSVFDLSRVAQPPSGHALGDRLGIDLVEGAVWQTCYRVAAWCDAAPSTPTTAHDAA